MEDDRTFFLHIPRTGGTSFTRALAKQYGRPVIIKTHDQLNSLVQDRASAPQLITGHFYAYQLPDWAYESADVITIVRHPIDRLISSYRYCRSEAAAGKALPPHMMYTTKVDFLEYAFSVHGCSDRHMALYILGLDAGEDASVTPLRTFLDRAKDRLCRYRCLVTEQVDEAIHGGQEPIERLNTTNAEGFEEEIRNNGLLQEVLQHDIELYEYAKELANAQGLPAFLKKDG